MARRFPHLLIVMVVGLATAGCGGGGGHEATTGTAPVTPTTGFPSTQGSLPDLGGQLMFSRLNESTHTFVSNHLANPDGSEVVELPVPGPEGAGRWSSDGRHIAVVTFVDDGRLGTAIIRPHGEVERTLEIPDPTLNLVCTTWSPDDTRLACEGWEDGDESRDGIYVVDAADGGNLIRLTTPPPGVLDRPGDFTADGRSLVFGRGPEEGRGPLMVVDVDGGSPRRLGTGEWDDPGRISPDGSAIATSGAGVVVVMDLDGEVIHEITNPGDYLFGPAWSPDGEWLAYSGASNGPHADIFISRLDGSNLYRVTDTPDNEIVVEWSHPDT